MSKDALPETQDRSGKSLPAQKDLERAVEIIEDAATAIDEMLRYNRAMKSVASQGVSHYRSAAEEARKEAERLSRQVAELLAEKQSATEKYEERIRALEQRIAKQDSELESMRSLLWPGGRGPR